MVKCNLTQSGITTDLEVDYSSKTARFILFIRGMEKDRERDFVFLGCIVRRYFPELHRKDSVFPVKSYCNHMISSEEAIFLVFKMCNITD